MKMFFFCMRIRNHFHINSSHLKQRLGPLGNGLLKLYYNQSDLNTNAGKDGSAFVETFESFL